MSFQEAIEELQGGKSKGVDFNFRIFDGLNSQKCPESRQLQEALGHLGGVSAGGKGDLKDRSEKTPSKTLGVGFWQLRL
jgi:hypothetical protein